MNKKSSLGVCALLALSCGAPTALAFGGIMALGGVRGSHVSSEASGNPQTNAIDYKDMNDQDKQCFQEGNQATEIETKQTQKKDYRDSEKPINNMVRDLNILFSLLLAMPFGAFFLRNGKGKKEYQNGDVYEGDWKKGLEHGKGKVEFQNGDVYEGDFVTRRRNGKEKNIDLMGNSYEEKLKDRQKVGTQCCRKEREQQEAETREAKEKKNAHKRLNMFLEKVNKTITGNNAIWIKFCEENTCLTFNKIENKIECTDGTLAEYKTSIKNLKSTIQGIEKKQREVHETNTVHQRLNTLLHSEAKGLNKQESSELVQSHNSVLLFDDKIQLLKAKEDGKVGDYDKAISAIRKALTQKKTMIETSVK